MSTGTPTELLKLWKLENMTPEMAVGHILQNLVKQQATLIDLRADVDRLIAQTRLPSNTKSKAKPSKPDETPDPDQPS
jgi:hypothetical protein